MKPTICLLAILCPLFCMAQTISGRILNDDNEPVPAATVAIKDINRVTTSDNRGFFRFEKLVARSPLTLLVTAVGYENSEILSTTDTTVSILLKKKITVLDEAIIMAYGQTTIRFNTGNITKVSGADIEKQPVSNPLAALSGRVPGLLVTQNSGVPGSTINIQIRGRTSLDLNLSQNDPLFIIDGVPFESGNVPINQLNSAANAPLITNFSLPSGHSPLNLINPLDIESIEVLKDADATAIYGSRGANGVILITTRKGKAGKTKFNLRMHTGLSRITRSMTMLNTSQYLEMRREAFANDGITPTISNAPDLLLWDTTQYHDYIKEFIGGTAQATDIQASLSGGNQQTQFSMSAGYHRETNVYPGPFADTRGSFHLNISHSPINKRWEMKFSTIYSSEKNRLFRTDLTRHIMIPPHVQLYTPEGKISWQQDGVSFSSVGITNPLAELEKKFSSLNQNLSANLQLRYKIVTGLELGASLGYNTLTSNEESITPRSSIAPESSGVANSLVATGLRTNWIIEPLAEYKTAIGGGKLHILMGTTFQERNSTKSDIQGSGYNNDLLLTSLDGATTISAGNSFQLYRYNAFFGRINYNWQQKYLVNFSARRDGSSRFGPGKQFSNFGAIGLGWIFSNEGWMKNQSLLSFGKIRASYGVTGNDQIGDYRYLDLWRFSFSPYQGIPGLVPSVLFNPDYHWERNRKLEVALELAFFNDRISFSTAYFQHRCSNQLVNYRLPNQTGFSTVVKNLPALVENKGWEIQLQSHNISRKYFSWKTEFNISVPSNKLVSFPGLAASSYNALYIEGQPLSVISRYRFLGVDPATGIYSYEDVNGDGIHSRPEDIQILGYLGPKWYGGLSNTFGWKQFQADIFFEYRNQIGTNFFGQLGYQPAGKMVNQPTLVLNRWRKPGDQAMVQRFFTASSNPAFQASGKLMASNAIFSDASYLRLKTLAIAYQFPKLVLENLKLESVKMYIQAQNLATFTNYNGPDPENQSYTQLPPLRTIVFGIQLTF